MRSRRLAVVFSRTSRRRRRAANSSPGSGRPHTGTGVLSSEGLPVQTVRTRRAPPNTPVPRTLRQ